MDPPRFSPIKQEYISARLEKGLSSGTIVQDDADLIKSYISEQQSTRHIKTSVALARTVYLIRWRDFIEKPFRQAAITDIHAGISGTDGKFKQNTRRSMIAVLKQFLQWMQENRKTKIPRKKIEEITVPKADRMTVMASELLTKEDIEAMIGACTNSRDRALVSVLAESACRIMELGTMTWSQVSFDQYGAMLNVAEKTGRPRPIRLIWSAEALAKWRSDYPDIPEGEAPVFLTITTKKSLTQSGVFSQLKRIAEKAGIKKRIHPHLFRHSRITELLRKNVPESAIKKLAWGGESRMIDIYGHLVTEDVDRALLEAAGIKIGEEKKLKSVTPGQCATCGTITGPLTRYCPNCGRSMTEQATMTQEELIKRLGELARNDPDRLVEALKRL